MEKHKGRQFKLFRSDEGGEFCGNKFEVFLKRKRIVRQMTDAYTHSEMGLLTGLTVQW